MPIQPPVAPWTFEAIGPLLWLGFAAYFIVTGRRNRSISLTALVFIGGTTMWWQEFFADWGGYVFYNPHLHLMTWWRHSTLTTPNKPWAVIPAYGWFYSLVYIPLVYGARRLSRHTTRLKTWQLIVLIGLPTYFLWDLLIEGVASLWGLWTYVHFTGPAISSSRGNFPLVYPIIPFAAVMVLTAVMINARASDGGPWIESVFNVTRVSGSAQTLRRVSSWIVGMNACYLCFTIMIVVVRTLFLPGSSIVK